MTVLDNFPKKLQSLKYPLRKTTKALFLSLLAQIIKGFFSFQDSQMFWLSTYHNSTAIVYLQVKAN